MRDIYWATVDGLVPVRRTVKHQYAQTFSTFIYSLRCLLIDASIKGLRLLKKAMHVLFCRYAKAVSDFSGYTVLSRADAGPLFAIPEDVECIAPEPGAAGANGAPPAFGEEHEEEEEGYEGEEGEDYAEEADEGYDGEHAEGYSDEEGPEEEEIVDEEGHAVAGGDSGAPHTDL